MSRTIRIIAILLSVLMIFSLVGCAQNNADKKDEDPTPDSATKEFNISEVQPIIKDGKYQYNPYLLSKEAIRSYDIGFLEFYRDFIKAFMNYETECDCVSVDYAKAIAMVLGYECSFYTGDDLDLSWSTGYDYENQKLSWTYMVDKDTLQTRIKLVSDIMQGFLDQVKPEDDEADKMQTLYHAFCPLMTYDNDRRVNREKIDSCYALIDHTGICVTFSNALAQILAQADIDASIANGLLSSGEDHAWDYVLINGQYYFFDPTFELNYQNGNAYVYYGMTLEEREKSGGVKENIFLGRYQDYEFNVAEIHLNVH